MIMALEITWENQPTLFLGHGADDRCHIGGRRNVLCKVKTKGNNKDINREEIIRYKNISNFSRWWQARQRWRKRRRVFLLLLRESAIGLSSLAGITRFFCLYDQIQIQIQIQIDKLLVDFDVKCIAGNLPTFVTSSKGIFHFYIWNIHDMLAVSVKAFFFSCF